MNVIPSISNTKDDRNKDDRKYRLLESRMQNSDQQYVDKSVTSPASDSEGISATMPHAASPTPEAPLQSFLPVPSIPSTAPSRAVAVFVPVFELHDTDDSKASISNKSQSRHGSSPNAKEEKDKENKTDNVKSLKRQSNGSNFDTKSPKLLKTEEIILVDQAAAMNQDTGSRGAASTKRTIMSYFHIQGDNNTLSAAIFPSTAPSSSSGPSPGPSALSGSSGSSSNTSSNAAANTSNTSNTSMNSLNVVDISSDPIPGISPPGTNKRDRNSTGGFNQKNSSSSSSFPVPAVISPEVKKQMEMMRIAKEQAESKMLRTEADLKASNLRIAQVEERNTRLCKSLEDIHRSSAMQDARKRRNQLAQDCVRLGKIVLMRMGPTNVQDVWEEGYALNELKRRSVELLERKEEFEKRRKKLQNLKRAAKKGPGPPVASSNLSMSAPDMDEEHYELDLDLAAEAEAIRTHLEQLKKDESGLLEEKRILEGEKAAHQKELKRCQSEDRSRFNRDLPCLNSRYVLLSMLGRGGFSEVWKALDLVELREVAVKVHQLNPLWSEEHKQRYIKNVTREYKIHREMRHPRVVDFYDVFEIDVNSFATVLEYCRGIDLDEKLKRCRTLPEREARTVLMQIISGLRYLNTPGDSQGGGMGDEEGGERGDRGERGGEGAGTGSRRKAIIHYDLKPANILFDEMGDAKITDFGLSKIIDDSHDGTSMELTSQGAGTYWYLPPECFVQGDARISSKVDVWSVGVIFFQMLFGRRPFGEGKSQERVLSEGIILNATQVEFPPASDTRAPKIPDEAKDLIRACLTADQKYRPDVHALCQHPYLKSGK